LFVVFYYLKKRGGDIGRQTRCASNDAERSPPREEVRALDIVKYEHKFI
jgi:hypothetical protein